MPEDPEFCDEHVDWQSDWLAERTNHLIGHGYQVLHVGQETTHGPTGEPWQRTTAVLGKPAD